MRHKLKASRLLSTLLSVILVLTMLPGTVWAETVAVTTETELRDAISTAVEGDSISINADITLTSDLNIAKNITLTSANGSTVNAETYKITVAAAGDVIFSGNLAVEGGAYYLIEVLGTFTLAGNASVERSNVNGAGAVYANYGGTVNIEGGAITETYSGGNGVNLSDNSSVLNMSGGVISGHTGIKILSGCTANINGGSIQGNTAVFVGSNGTAEIGGGILTGSSFSVQTAGTATIAGGTITGKVWTLEGGSLNLDGGDVDLDGGVYFYDSGNQRCFLSAIPGAVSMETSGTETMLLQGTFERVSFSIDAATDSELDAEISGSAVTLNPSVPGSYELVLKAQGMTDASIPLQQFFTLTIPVEVEDTPGPTAPDAPPVRIAAGPEHTLFLKQDGTVWSWGYNDKCQLGYGPSGNGRLIPDQIQGLSDIVSIDTGHQHSLALDENGDVWIWGGNEFGQQGNGGTGGLQATPIKVSGLSDVKAIAAGWAHSLALKENGTLWAWGYNSEGQLGDGSEMTRTSPVQVMTDVAAISAGNHHSLVLKNDGTVWAWGGNGDGQLGDNTTTKKSSPQQVPGLAGVSRVYASGHNSAALVGDDLYLWGDNYIGQLGDNNRPNDRKTIGPALLDEVEDFSGSGLGGFFIAKAGNSVYVWGYNDEGELGNGTNSERLTPTVSSALSAIDIQAFAVAERSNHCLAIDDEGTLWAWGYNNHGQLGDGSQDNSNVPVRVQFPGTPPATGDAEWHYRSPVPANNIMQNVQFINGKYFAVGYNGTLITSDDGETWQKVEVGADTDQLTGIAYGENKYVIVGTASYYAARIYTSDDGLIWRETAAIPDTSGLRDVIYANGKFVAVGLSGKVAVSDDGENWDVIQMVPITANAMDYNLLAVTYADGKYVAAGTRKHTGITQRGAVLTSADGVSWSVTHTQSTSTIWDVTYGGGVFTAVGGVSYQAGNHYICTSSDGVTWTPRSVTGAPGSNSCFYSVQYDGSRFIAVGSTTGTSPSKAYIATSENGTVWTYRGNSSVTSFKAVASDASGSRYVAMGGTGYIYSSDDGGSSWTYRTLGAAKTLWDVAGNGSGLYVAVGDEGTIQTSTNGAIWTIKTSGTSYDLIKVDYLNGQFIAVGEHGTILTSVNGTDWISSNSGTTDDLRDITYGEGIYVTGGNGAARISSDGISWSAPAGLITLKTVAYGNGGFVALSQTGTAFKSDDGVNWTNCGSLYQFAEYPTDMIYAEGKFVAVGGSGKIFMSTNGVIWTTVQSDINQDYIQDITYVDGKFAAVADNGKIIGSADGGESWFLQPSGLTPNHYFSLEQDAQLHGIAVGSDSFVAVGGNGIILQSEDLSISTDQDTHDVAMAKSRLFINNILGSGSNNNEGSIVANMNLMTSWNYDTSISWTNSKPQYIAANGNVIRPSFGDGDQVVCLTATITKGSASVTKKFIVVVIAQANPDIAIVDAAAAALTFDVIKLGNTAQDNIVSDLNLTTAGISGTTVNWASNKPAYITTGGAVTRPAEGAADQAVTLTATIIKGAVSRTQTFYLTVKALVSQDAQSVANAKADLTFDVIKLGNAGANDIISSLNLPTVGTSGTAISWASNKPAYITTGGAVTRPAQGTSDETVTLTATITRGSASDTKTFTLKVLAIPSVPAEGTNPGNNTGSGGSSPPPSLKADVSGIGASGTLPVSVNAGSNSATVTAGAQQGNSLTGGNPVVIAMPSIPGVNSFTLEIPADYLSAPNGEGVLTLTTNTGSVTMPSTMLTNTEGEKAKITISKGDTSKLTGDVKAAIGDRPLVQLTLTLDGKQAAWNNPDAPVTVAIPYTPTEEELADPEKIVVWYIDGAGNVVSVPSGRYDPATGTVTFTTTHFSDYAIAYVHKTFSDLNDVKWAKKAIEAMASKGITNGTGGNTFSPEAGITRADYMVMLIKSLGLTASFEQNFADVPSGVYYYEALGIARELGIATGRGDNRFLPKERISRQDMMVLTARALEKAGKLEQGSDPAILDQFSDKAGISGYAADSLAALVKRGLITGSGNKLNPRGDTTRAEAAVFLYRIYNQ